ncbi:MAG: O-linked N-acetylglucosamine transferase family protein, partial [Planctomycetota bacterium]|jgi:hypothetical protein
MPKRRKKRKPSQKKVKPPFVVQEDGTELPITYRQRLYTMLYKGQHEEICKSILEVLYYFQQHNFRAINEEGLRRLDELVSAIMAALSDPGFNFPHKYIPLMISRGHLFANMVAISSYKDTDAILNNIIHQEDNYFKILFLYGVRNMSHIKPEVLFDHDPTLASVWFFTYPLAPVGCVLPHYQVNMRKHFQTIDERYRPFDQRVTLPYFYCTYFAGEDRSDRRTKEIVNRGCQEFLAKQEINIVNKPDRKSIGIVTSKWSPHTAVYKSCFPFLDRFKQRGYRMTLMHTGPYAIPEHAKSGYFDEIINMQFTKDARGAHELPVAKIQENDFRLLYYPDIGMTDESVWLSNLRLAPIQVTSYGHPVSTFGSKIDYFVVGDETEKIDDLKKNYSETPIVLPGLGCVPVWPTFKRKYPEQRTDKVVVNCVWGPDKYNYTMMRTMQELHRRCPDIHFKIFASRGVHRYNAFIPFANEIAQQVGEFATLHSDKEYLAYMEAAESADFALNSWPFGGYNTVVEALYLGKPVVTLEGDRFYNMAASALLRRVGLEELIAHDGREFLDITTRMTNDAAYRADVTARLLAVDLRKAIFDTDEPDYFEAAMEHILDNHETLDRTKPIFARELL